MPFRNKLFRNRLVAGAHRLAAAKSLGWSHIDCIEGDDDALRAELWEIDENLMRAELSPAQQADHLARRKVIWEELQKVEQIVPPISGQTKGFASDTANKTGVNKATVNRDIARATALGSDIRAVVGTSLDKGVELDALAKMTADLDGVWNSCADYAAGQAASTASPA